MIKCSFTCHCHLSGKCIVSLFFFFFCSMRKRNDRSDRFLTSLLKGVTFRIEVEKQEKRTHREIKVFVFLTENSSLNTALNRLRANSIFLFSVICSSRGSKKRLRQLVNYYLLFIIYSSDRSENDIDNRRKKTICNELFFLFTEKILKRNDSFRSMFFDFVSDEINWFLARLNDSNELSD